MIMHLLLLVLGFATYSGETPDTATASLAQTPASQTTLQPEDQTPSGQFTTATEVKPILTATKPNWVAVRDYNGQDLVYITHLWAWRCGLIKVEYAINDGGFQDWPLPECHLGTAQPNGITDGDGLPYKSFAQGSVSDVSIRITYDDLTLDEVTWPRARILLP